MRTGQNLTVALLAAAALGAAGATCADAHSPNFGVSPRHPYVNDVITVSWANQRTLPKNERYYAFIAVGQMGVHCSWNVETHSDPGLTKGTRVHLRFNPAKQELGSPRWCPGPAKITAGAATRQWTGYRFVGGTRLRIYPEPKQRDDLVPSWLPTPRPSRALGFPFG
jgi:hypothetical protein